MIIAGTGHRPDKLGGYGLSQHTRLRAFAKSELKRSNPNRVISGMAAGWDLALADAAFILDIPFTAAVPFEGHDAMWNYDYRDLSRPSFEGRLRSYSLQRRLRACKNAKPQSLDG